LVAFGIFFVGWTEGLAITIETLAAENQSELGTDSGVAGSIRFLISSIAVTVYSVILSNRVAKTIATQFPRLSLKLDFHQRVLRNSSPNFWPGLRRWKPSQVLRSRSLSWEPEHSKLPMRTRIVQCSSPTWRFLVSPLSALSCYRRLTI
jgi:hypothetical protein